MAESKFALTPGWKRMGERKKRTRGSNWNHAHTMALAELKREASLNKEDGPLVWERFAQTLSSRFPGQIRTGAQCRRRWDTLVKVYNHIEDYCVVTGALGHRELDEGELASMELDTTYQQDWYDIVERVCSQRKRKERCDRDLMLAKRSKDSHFVKLPGRPPNSFSASSSKSVNYHEQSTPESTTTYAQVSFSSSLKANKLSPEEETPRLKIGSGGLVLDATQLWQLGQVYHEVSQERQTLESANLLPLNFPAEIRAQLKEPLQDDLWDLVEAMPFETSVEIEQPDTKSELTGPFYWDLELVGLGAQPKELLHDHVRDDSLETANTSIAPSASIASDDWNARNFWKVMYTRNASVASSSSSGVTLFSEPPLLSSAIMTASTSSRSSDSTISRQSRRWSLKVIVLKVRQFSHACGRKERTEDMEMESKQADRLKEKARKKALMSRKEIVPAMLSAASSTSATTATRGDKPLQKDTERISKQAAWDKKEEETRSRKAERQQLGSKSSSKCVPVRQLCAKLRWKLFPAFHGQPPH